ncbi:hypothetical protein BC629DRAFT_258991 [Irpex lacteus]|nr:hypothetical protein BC629DRAFT_258991 [Irpex lacteus]
MSTDWIEHREANEEDRYESSSNIELVHLREYDSLEQPDVTLNTALSIIQASFHAVSREYDINTSEELLTASTLSPPSSQHHLSSALISSLLNPSSSGDDLLFTAVIVVPSSPPSPADDSLIVELRKYIPVIVLTTPGGPQEEEDTPKLDSHIPPSPSYSSLHLSNSRLTCSPSDIRTILYQNTHALSSLRKEAAELFLLWAGFSPQSVAKALELSSVDKSSDSSPRPFDPRDSDDVREQVQGREPDDRLDGTVKARTSTQYPYQPHQSDRESPQTRRGSTTKAARDRNGCTGASTGSGTLRGRPRGQTMERRKTITAATHPRPVVGPLARLDSLVQSQSQSTSQPSSASAPPVQSRRRRYAAEHGLSTGSTTVPNAQSPGYGHPLPPSSFSTFDPLHIPSLIRLAVEGLLLGPLRLRLSRLFGVAGGPVQDMAGEKGVEDLCTSDSDVKTRSRVSSFVPIALIAGAFCAGVGVGIVFTRAGI